MWQGVSIMVRTHAKHNPVAASCTLSTEAGMMGALSTVRV